ncbi:hypothetical protein K5B08_01085, partial [Candidatus Carsonella ruddii]|nr:hypothetical protein [Candidatus Carsonella ruddii]
MLKILDKISFIKKSFTKIKDKVKTIIKDIKKYGENALKFYINKIDGIYIKKIKKIIINNK